MTVGPIQLLISFYLRAQWSRNMVCVNSHLKSNRVRYIQNCAIQVRNAMGQSIFAEIENILLVLKRSSLSQRNPWLVWTGLRMMGRGYGSVGRAIASDTWVRTSNPLYYIVCRNPFLAELNHALPRNLSLFTSDVFKFRALKFSDYYYYCFFVSLDISNSGKLTRGWWTSPLINTKEGKK